MSSDSVSVRSAHMVVVRLSPREDDGLVIDSERCRCNARLAAPYFVMSRWIQSHLLILHNTVLSLFWAGLLRSDLFEFDSRIFHTSKCKTHRFLKHAALMYVCLFCVTAIYSYCAHSFHQKLNVVFSTCDILQLFN